MVEPAASIEEHKQRSQVLKNDLDKNIFETIGNYQTDKSWLEDMHDINVEMKGAFRRCHPQMKRCGFIYDTETCLKEMAKMRLLIEKFEKMTDNHFFLMKICDHFGVEQP